MCYSAALTYIFIFRPMFVISQIRLMLLHCSSKCEDPQCKTEVFTEGNRSTVVLMGQRYHKLIRLTLTDWLTFFTSLSETRFSLLRCSAESRFVCLTVRGKQLSFSCAIALGHIWKSWVELTSLYSCDHLTKLL